MSKRTMSVEKFHELFCNREGACIDGVWIGSCKSTKIYCRPVCGVHPPRMENVRVFPSAAAAEAAGFRPCLSCCPEAAPKPTAASDINPEALKLAEAIEEAVCKTDPVGSALTVCNTSAKEAEELMDEAFGVSCAQYAATARRLEAKRLLRETTDSVDAIALACGYEDGNALRADFKTAYKLDADKLASKKPHSPRISKKSR